VPNTPNPLPGLPAISLDPALVLVIFLPPLLLDGAWFIPLRPLKRHLIGILSLAIGAVVFTTIVVAIVVHALMPSLPWAACAALGAIVSPPDAVSARAVLQRVHLPQRLSTLLEGESLLNDATGLVLFRFAIAAVVTGAFSVSDAFNSFLLLAFGGAAVGVAVGLVWLVVVRRLQDDYLTIVASVLVAWAAYLLAETLHVSGVIATVVAGLICGWYQHVVLSAAIRMRGTSFWTVLVFLLEASVFMLIGSSLRGVVERVGGVQVVLEEMAAPIGLILLALTVARFAWVYGSDAVVALQRKLGFERFDPIGPRASAVLSWAGMRGVVTLAVALSVPESMPGRDFMLVTAFAVILVTVLVQGTTLGLIIRWARPEEAAVYRARFNMSEAEASMAQAQLMARLSPIAEPRWSAATCSTAMAMPSPIRPHPLLASTAAVAGPPMRGCRIRIRLVNTTGNNAMMPLIVAPTRPERVTTMATTVATSAARNGISYQRRVISGILAPRKRCTSGRTSAKAATLSAIPTPP